MNPKNYYINDTTWLTTTREKVGELRGEKSFYPPNKQKHPDAC